MPKKKKETPKKILDKIKEIENSEVSYTIDNNALDIKIEGHEVYQYLRHRKSGPRTYDPLHGYKKVLKSKLREIFKNKEVKKLIDNNYENPIIISLEVQKNPVNKTDSIKSILYKSLNKIERIYTPDIDNFQKTVYDVMNEDFWKDDAQVVYTKSYKKYSEDFIDRTLIRITYLNHEIKESKGRMEKELINEHEDLINEIKKKKDELRNEK